jgi:hypothetical protein
MEQRDPGRKRALLPDVSKADPQQPDGNALCVSHCNRRRVRIMRGRCMLRQSQPTDGLSMKLIILAARAVAGATPMRFGVVVLIALSCVGCARFQKPAAEASAPQPTAAPDKPAEKSAPVADAAPARFECSDGTISTSQDACLVSMARARLPSRAN